MMECVAGSDAGPDAQQVWRVACLGSKSTVEQRFVNPALPESAVRLGLAWRTPDVTEQRRARGW